MTITQTINIPTEHSHPIKGIAGVELDELVTLRQVLDLIPKIKKVELVLNGTKLKVIIDDVESNEIDLSIISTNAPSRQTNIIDTTYKGIRQK